MKNDLTCEVVRDLLPSYVDGLTNDVSNQAVEQHIKICENCRKLYHEMQETVNGEYLSSRIWNRWDKRPISKCHLK